MHETNGGEAGAVPKINLCPFFVGRKRSTFLHRYRMDRQPNECRTALQQDPLRVTGNSVQRLDEKRTSQLYTEKSKKFKREPVGQQREHYSRDLTNVKTKNAEKTRRPDLKGNGQSDNEFDKGYGAQSPSLTQPQSVRAESIHVVPKTPRQRYRQNT